MREAADLEFRARSGGRPLGRVVYSASDIAARVSEMGAEITAAYPMEDDVLLLGFLKGSFVFMGDLVRRIRRPLQVDFLVASSYGTGTESSGQVELLYDPRGPVEGRHVIIVEDIVDSGTTLNQLCGGLVERGPASLEICALLHKRITTDLRWEPRWVGFDAPNEFLVGYGLDYAENYRHLPFIATPGA
ncbi:hypoxanthine phosphoribosyltransferase [Candidatus Palauibacter sp.]|uniref:hypoxanthine phosphoribosyltransferase n=1 Tax=Candidatus Palauibacter sp. TaxID=3101350 RepID=UPI003B025F06